MLSVLALLFLSRALPPLFSSCLLLPFPVPFPLPLSSSLLALCPYIYLAHACMIMSLQELCPYRVVFQGSRVLATADCYPWAPRLIWLSCAGGIVTRCAGPVLIAASSQVTFVKTIASLRSACPQSSGPKGSAHHTVLNVRPSTAFVHFCRRQHWVQPPPWKDT